MKRGTGGPTPTRQSVGRRITLLSSILSIAHVHLFIFRTKQAPVVVNNSSRKEDTKPQVRREMGGGVSCAAFKGDNEGLI